MMHRAARPLRGAGTPVIGRRRRITWIGRLECAVVGHESLPVAVDRHMRLVWRCQRCGCTDH